MRILYPGLSKLICAKWRSIKEQYYNDPEQAIFEVIFWKWETEYLYSLNRRTCLAGVKVNGLNLKYGGKYRDDRPLVIWAIKQNGQALQYASIRLQDDDKVVKIALKRSWFCLQYASVRLQGILGYKVNTVVNQTINAHNPNQDEDLPF